MRKALLILLTFAGLGIGSASGQPARSVPPSKSPSPTTPSPVAESASALIKEGTELLKNERYAEAEKKLRKADELALPESDEEKTVKKLLQIVLTRQAAALISDADRLQTGQDYAEAEKKLRAALDIAPPDAQVRKDAEARLQAMISIQMQIAQLEEARRLPGEGKVSEALTLIQKVLSEAKQTQVIEQAKTALAEAHSIRAKVIEHYSQTLWLILDIILGLVGAWILFKLIRAFYAMAQGDEYLVFAIEDATSLKVGEQVVASLSRWSGAQMPVSAGLLKLELLQLPSAPDLQFQDVSLDLEPALESLSLQIGGVNLGAVAKAIAPIRRWLNATRPWVKGSAFLESDTNVVVRLTRRRADGTTNTITVSAEKAQSLDAAERASYQMYYLLAKPKTTVSEAEAANKLREGLNLLRQYISGHKPDRLDAAYEAFCGARQENPALNVAYLYEGVTLDLLERHEEAIIRFHHLKQPQNTVDPVLREKARYNEAISRFRKYEPEELESAIQILDNLIRSRPVSDDPPGTAAPGAAPAAAGYVACTDAKIQELVDSPPKALALAAKANAIAHRPIFWQELLFAGDRSREEHVVLTRKTQSQGTINQWVGEVEGITADLKRVHERLSGDEAWDDFAKQQLKWAIQNACGNLYLNCAKSLLSLPALPGTEAQRNQYLERAYQAFQECEMLLPLGVETLTNLGTALSELHREAQARHHLDRAIKLNRHYEYAYYRKAQSWEKENRIDKVVEVLKAFARERTPGIPGFRELYQKYSTELAQT